MGDDGYLTDFITTGIALQEREQIGHLPRGQGLLGRGRCPDPHVRVFAS